jgi:tRNA threonylcarbamoyladenosine biosynthesis protein TsaE
MTVEERFGKTELADLPDVARKIVSYFDKTRIWLFKGDLGAGKTTLIKQIGEAIGVEDTMSSPTFAIVNEYAGRDFRKVYHFDFYRLRSEMEAYDIGVEEYFDSGYPCLIEWPDKIPSLIPEYRGEVSITIENETQRTIAISVHVGKGKEENRV